MKVFLRDIPADGERWIVQETMTAGAIDVPESGFHILSDLDVTAQFLKTEDMVVVHVDVKTRCRFTCSRCLEEVEQDRLIPFDLDVDITPDMEFVDIDNDIREELIIAISPIVVCQEDCRGLCPHCGRNLNTETCVCPREK